MAPARRVAKAPRGAWAESQRKPPLAPPHLPEELGSGEYPVHNPNTWPAWKNGDNNGDVTRRRPEESSRAFQQPSLEGSLEGLGHMHVAKLDSRCSGSKNPLVSRSILFCGGLALETAPREPQGSPRSPRSHTLCTGAVSTPLTGSQKLGRPSGTA